MSSTKIINTSLHSFAFVTAVMCLLNLPAFMSATRGNGSLMSYAMLGSSLVLFVYLFFKNRFDANNMLSLLTLTIFSYLVIGLLTKFIWEESDLTNKGSAAVEDWTYIVQLMVQNLLVMWGSYKYTLFCHSQGHLHRFVNVLVAIALFSCLITIFSPFLGFYQSGFFVSESASSGGLTRPAGLFLNPNSAGFHSVITLLFVMSLLFRKKTNRIGVFIMIIITLFSAILTLSKGAILMSIIVIVSYFGLSTVYFNRLQSSSKWSFIIVGSLIIASIVQFIAIVMAEYNYLGAFEQSRVDQIMGLLGGKVNSETTTTRTDLAAIGLQWISESPIVGWGFGAFHYFKSGDAGIHNMFLMLIGESGFVPMLLYILFFIFGLYKSLKIKNMEYRFLSLTFFLFTLFFANGNHNLFDNYEIGFLFGFICALSKIDSIEQFEQDIEEEFDTDIERS
jgi:O-antigen ligase